MRIAKIPALVGEVDQSVIESEFDGHQRMASRKLREQRSDLSRAECNRDIETKQSPGLEAIRGHGGIGCFNIGEDAFRRFEVVAPDFGDREPARGAVKELHAQPGFKGGDVLRHHGLRHAHGAAGGRKAAGSGYLREHFHAS